MFELCEKKNAGINTNTSAQSIYIYIFIFSGTMQYMGIIGETGWQLKGASSFLPLVSKCVPRRTAPVSIKRPNF